MTNATLAPVVALPTLDLAGKDPYMYGYGASFYRNDHFDRRGEFARWVGSAEYHDHALTNLPSMALSHWNEAHNINALIERAKVEATVETAPVRIDSTAKLRTLIEESNRKTRMLEEAGKAYAEQLVLISQIRATLSTAQTAQITGDDPRLTEFWERAQEVANDAGHCEEYDRMATELGGPARKREAVVYVTETYTYRVTMMVTNEEYNCDRLDQLDELDLDDFTESEREVSSIRWT